MLLQAPAHWAEAGARAVPPQTARIAFMQLVKTSRDNLLRPLQIVSGIVERRHTLPILANLLIRKTGERVSFLSTGLADQHWQ